MRRSGVWTLVFLGVMGFALVGLAEDPRDVLRKALYRRYQLSQIEIEETGRRGAVVRKGVLLMLAADVVPAKPFRVIQAGRGSLHVMDFARVEIALDGRLQAEAAPLRLAKGTRLVVLEVKVEGDRVHLLTHTADPLPIAWAGAGAYGCTEFVFGFDPSGVARAGGNPCSSSSSAGSSGRRRSGSARQASSRFVSSHENSPKG